MNCYTVFKKTASHADVLAAIGAADVLRHLEPRIVDLEDRFEVRFRKQLVPSDLEAVDPGFSYFERPSKKAPNVPPERIVRSRRAEVDGATPQATVAENRMYTILGRMKAFGGPNKVISRFARMKREEWERRVWECMHGSSRFVFSWPLVQLFNPHSGRGYALLKPSGTSRSDKTKDCWAEPFLEWLRFRGYFEGGAGWFTSGDLRLFCPIPGDIRYDHFSTAVSAFRQLRLGGTSAKIDCRAVLGLTRLLIESAESYRRPRQAVRGIWATHYKDMGQAHTFMAMEQLSIPDWFDLRTLQQAQQWLRTLEEHDTILRRLTDSHSDELGLLKQYRRTFQTRWEESIPEFAEFMMGYGMLVFKRRAQDHWILPQLTVGGTASILRRDPHLRTILRNPGFIAVAGAIRGSTVGAQAAWRNGKLDHRQIRYGLLSDIRRAGLVGRAELLTVVSSFISEFNRESMRRRNAGLKSMQIETGEMDEFADLLNRWTCSVPAGSLLCGMSTCIPGAGASVEIEPEVLRAMSA